jgi:anti-anti-sigma regulatory factor
MSNASDPTARATAITLEGDLTLPRAEEMKGLFANALSGADTVVVGFKNVGDIDLSFLQLVCSLHRSAERDKKQVRIEGVAPKVLKETAEAAGYLRLAGCKLDCDKSCLWVTIAGARIG